MNQKSLFLSVSSLLILPLAHAAPSIDMSSQVTNQVSRTVSSGIAKNLFDNLVIPELKVRNSAGVVKQMQASADKHFLSLLLADGSTRVWDLDLGIQRPAVFGKQTSRIAVDAHEQVLFTGGANGISSYDVLTAQARAALPMNLGEINDLAVSDDGSLLLIASDKQNLTLWDTKTNKMTWQQANLSGVVRSISFSGDKRYLAVVCHDENSGSDIVEVRRLGSGKKLRTFTNGSQPVVFEKFKFDNSLEVVFGNGESTVWDTQDGSVLSTKKLSTPIVAVDKVENTYSYALADGSVLIADGKGNKIITIAKENNPIRAVALLAQGKKLITATQNGQVFLWNVADGKELLQLISTTQGWTVLDSSGRFDSSEAGMPNVSWQAGEQDIPFDNIANKYYEPGLLSSALNDENYLITKPTVIQQGITLPPKLEVAVNNNAVTNDDVELTVDVYDQGGGIDAVNLYHNAKAINVKRAVVSDTTVTDENDKAHRTLTLKLQPTAGQNQVKAIASNKIGIENQSKETIFNSTRSAKPAKLKLATIGINQYADKNLNLDYSVADAQLINQILSQKQGLKFVSIDSKQMYNQNANKASILAALRELSHGEKEDTLAIYFAGHGISVNGEWYFLPYETTLHSDLNYFASVGISATEIGDIFKDSNIQHILLMIDACYSGASLDSFKKLQDSQRKFSRTISRSVGITIVTATRKNQKAAELAELGHGLFTYVLGKGMRGEADFMPQNKEISAHEIADFSTRTIPNFAKRYTDSAQEPTAFTIGRDFVVFDKK